MASSDSLSGPRPETGVQSSGLLGQTVVVIDGVSGIGLATARTAKGAGARLIITGSDAGKLEDVADEVGVEATEALDAQDVQLLGAFLLGLPTRVDHVVLGLRTTPPARLDEGTFAEVRQHLEQLVLPLCVTWFAVREMTEGGSLVFVAGATDQPPRIVVSAAMATSALSALVATFAQETATLRINLITPTGLDPPEAIAALAVRLMIDTAVTGVICGTTQF